MIAMIAVGIDANAGTGLEPLTVSSSDGEGAPHGPPESARAPADRPGASRFDREAPNHLLE